MAATKKTAGIASAASEVAFYARAMKAPRIPGAAASMASRAREQGWDYEQFLAAVLAEEVTARESHGGAARVKAARFPQIKTLDDFDFASQRSVDRTTIAHRAQLDFLREADNVVFLGPPGTGKTHLSIALGVQAARRGHRVAFATAHEWVQRLTAANRAGKLDLDLELERLGRIPLLIIDEVGYIPFAPDAAALLFAHSDPVLRGDEIEVSRLLVEVVIRSKRVMLSPLLTPDWPVGQGQPRVARGGDDEMPAPAEAPPPDRRDGRSTEGPRGGRPPVASARASTRGTPPGPKTGDGRTGARRATLAPPQHR